MKKAVTLLGKFNTMLLIVWILLWLVSFISQGVFSSLAWVSLKLFLPFAGFGIVVLNLVLLLFRRFRNIRIRFTSLAVGIIYILPILLTMNIVLIAYPASLSNTEPAVSIHSPFKHEAIAAWGGNEIKNNLPHAGWSSERWAYDLVMTPYDTGDTRLDSYGIWAENVYSPVNGTIVEAYDQDYDIPPNQEEFESQEGNYVYIRIEETGTYLLINHLMQNSVTLSSGDTVHTGDLIGQVGNSGTTSEPHLHIHHQKENPTEVIHPILATGLPLYFENAGNSSMPVKGTLLPGF